MLPWNDRWHSPWRLATLLCLLRSALPLVLLPLGGGDRHPAMLASFSTLGLNLALHQTLPRIFASSCLLALSLHQFSVCAMHLHWPRAPATSAVTSLTSGHLSVTAARKEEQGSGSRERK